VNYSFDLKVVNSFNGGVVFIHIWDVNSSGGVIDQGPGLLGPYFNSSWATISGSFTAPASVNHLEVEIDCTTGAATGSAEAVRVDNVSLTQAVPEPTTVTLVGFSESESGICTKPFVPSKRKPCPTLPGTKLAPPSNVPLFPLTVSVALPSAGHQATSPSGGVTQSA